MNEFMYIKDTRSWSEKLVGCVYKVPWFGMTKVATAERGSLQQKVYGNIPGTRFIVASCDDTTIVNKGQRS